MKSINIFAFCTGLFFTAFSLSSCFGQNKSEMVRAGQKANGKGFAVLELFTSEGCSSCPPVEALLAEIQKKTANENVYILAFHVDYWNRLGWTDIFSKPAYSSRQGQYQNWLNTSQIYTPQLVINGKMEFVGSDENAVRHAIAEQLEVNTNATLKIEAHQNNHQISIQYLSSGAGKENDLVTALIEKQAESNVKRGENAGRKLTHVQIVSDIQSTPLNTAKGFATMAFPNDVNPENYEVIAFIQNRNTGKIIAASKAALSSAAVQPATSSN